METYQVFVLFVCAAIFGIVARNLTKDERSIYKKRQYFPTFKIVLLFASLLSLTINSDISVVFLSILIMVLFWDTEKFNKGKKK